MPEITYFSDNIESGRYDVLCDGFKIGNMRRNKRGVLNFTHTQSASGILDHNEIASLEKFEKKVKKEISRDWLKARRSKFYTTHTDVMGTDKHIMLIQKAGVAVGVAINNANNNGFTFTPTPDLRLKPMKVSTLAQLHVKIALSLKKGTLPTNWDNARINKLVKQQKK